MITKSNIPMIKEVYEWATAIIIVVITYVFLTSIYQFVRVDGNSMEPTLQNNDVVIVNKLSYRFGSISKGDVVIFPYKEDPSKTYVKRVIGLPGDQINIVDSKVYINEQCIEEPYIYESMRNKGNVEFPLVVPKNFYFVLGDNRNYSTDSRYSEVGMIHHEDIIGKVQIRVWPFNGIGIF